MEKFRELIFGNAGVVLELPHKYDMGQILRYAAQEVKSDRLLKVLGRNLRENAGGMALSYRCREIYCGEPTAKVLEVDEHEVQPLDAA